MKKRNYAHLIKNLERISSDNSIFNYKPGQKTSLALGKGNIRDWLGKLLPNTRLILEPKIIGSSISIQYVNGALTKAINKNSEDIMNEVKSIKCVPQSLPLKKRIEIRGVLYENKNTSQNKRTMAYEEIRQPSKEKKELIFCAFQIYHCKINQFQALLELKNLDFKIPKTYFTKFISDIEIYRQCWKEGKIFQNYPTSGIVLKINSRKLQKRLGENNLLINWAYAIN